MISNITIKRAYSVNTVIYVK